jgi:hypothetical protein
VDDNEIRIRGSHAALVQRIAGRPEEAAGGVPSFVQGWWARQDSNLRQHRYERREKARTAAEVLGFSMQLAKSGCK